MRVRMLSIAVVAALLAASAQAGGDGAIEINATLAAASGGFPISINGPGLFRLTSNLDGHGTSAALIRIGGNATVDLNGFALWNGGFGVFGFGDGITVRNGSISGMSNTAIYLQGSGGRVERVRAIGNAGGIALTGEAGWVADSVVASSGAVIVHSGTVRGCVVTGSSDGITSTTSTTVDLLLVTENAAIGNTQNGLATRNATISRNLLVGNGTGLVLYALAQRFSSVAGNVINGSSSWTTNAVSTRPNVCNGSPC